jgi:hypothetical protein
VSKLAIKRLTASDLTIFKWQFDNSPSNQKSINLNADVFVDQLYPTLANTDPGRAGRLPLELFLYGPGYARAHNLTRKIIKGDSYKNWRLNGEYINNPDESPDRFNVLAPGDYAIIDFEGELFPNAARIVFVSAALPEDSRLHAGIRDSGNNSMRSTTIAELHLIAIASGTPESHPVFELLLDSAIEDAALGGLAGTTKLLQRTTGRKLTRAALDRARQLADDIGRLGEEVIDLYFATLVEKGSIERYDWVANENAISPFDFRIHETKDNSVKVEVKSTTGDFSQAFHVSIAQLLDMRDSSERFDLYRVYQLDEHRATVRVKRDMREFAARLLQVFESVPTGVTVDSISVRGESLTFDDEFTISTNNNES